MKCYLVRTHDFINVQAGCLISWCLFFFRLHLFFHSGTIKPRSFRAWSAKYHVIIVFILMLPIIFLCVWETVGLVVGSYSDYGQSYVQNVGTVGGTGNQMRGACKR